MSDDEDLKRVAYTITHEPEPRLFFAENEAVLSRVVALELVAASPPASFAKADLAAIRRSLLEERWADAVAGWIHATGIYVDAFPGERVWNERQLDEERAGLELRVAPIFDDGG